MPITKEGALNDFWNTKPEVTVKIEGTTAYFTSELNYADEEEIFQKSYCDECKKTTVSSMASYQSEFTCNTCGSEVLEEE